MSKDHKHPANRIPVGMERVLYLAATNPAFHQALAQDPEQAIKEEGLTLRKSELAMLKAVPLSMLLANVNKVDPSPENLQRRTFLRAVAASAMTVAAADALAGCKDTDKNNAGVPANRDYLTDLPRDAGVDNDVGMKAGIPPDMPATVKDAGDDLVKAPDQGPAATGIRPGGG